MDRTTIEDFGVAGYTLMQQAAAAALESLRAGFPDATSVRIYCGLGNNAGDGFVLAGMLRQAGMRVEVVQCAASEQLRGDAATARRDCAAAGVAVTDFVPGLQAAPGQVLVDALFGTGLSRPLRGVFAQAVEQINGAGAPVLALDVPSGLDAATGHADGPVVRATATLAFVGLKTGYFLGIGPDCCGRIECAELAVPAAVRNAHRPLLRRLALADIRDALPARSRLAHKGDGGRVLVIGGAPGMAGAVRLAGEAALRAGAGLVHVATHPGHAAHVCALRPELIVHGVESAADVAALGTSCDVIVIGPGLGRSAWARELCAWAVAQPVPLVIDADGLNWLAELGATQLGSRCVLTPHPGEAGRLLGSSAAEIQQDRLGAVRAIAARYGCLAVLKGACTLLAAAAAAADTADTVEQVCLAGNPGMATPGAGDVLAGLIGGVLAQCGRVHAAAAAAVLVHALAGDCAAAADGERGLLASDLLIATRRWINLR